jgi:uncharacterized protein YjbI with pentapeptide repeats
MDQFEPPKYLSSLTATINDGSKSVQAGTLAFTVVGLYLVATAFSATDELVRTTPVARLGVQLPVTSSFAIAPIVFVLRHIYTLIRYDMQAANVRQFRVDLRAMLPIEADRERCRQLLANMEFVQAIAIPSTSVLRNSLYRVAVWIMTAAFPVLVLFLVQISALRYQDETVTAAQRIVLGADLIGLLWFFQRRRRWQSDDDRSEDSALGFSRRAGLAALILLTNLVYLNVPGPDDETVGPLRAPGWGGIAAAPLDVLCGRFGRACRYLDVSHRTLFTQVWDNRALIELRQGTVRPDARAALGGTFLRGRGLRFANLSESDLFGADLRNDDLRHADLSSARLQGADLTGANLQAADLQRAWLQGAQLYQARLAAANLSYAQLRGADLNRARLPAALLSYADLRATTLWGAELVGAQLHGADLRGAQIRLADLFGTQFVAAQLQCSQPLGAQFLGAVLLSGDLTPEQQEAVRPLFETKDQCTRLWHVQVNALSSFGLANFDTTLTESELRELFEALADSMQLPLRTILAYRLDGRLDETKTFSVTPTFRPDVPPALVDNPIPGALSAADPHAVMVDEPGYWTELTKWTLGDPAARSEPAIAQRVIEVFVGEALGRNKGRRPAPAALVDTACRFLHAAEAGTIQLTDQQVSRLRQAAGKCQADSAATGGTDAARTDGDNEQRFRQSHCNEDHFEGRSRLRHGTGRHLVANDHE